MAIPRAYQTDSEKAEHVHCVKAYLGAEIEPMHTQSILAAEPKLRVKKRPIHLSRNRKYLKFGLLYIFLFCVVKCFHVLSKWENDGYILNTLGVSFSFGKKAAASTAVPVSAKDSKMDTLKNKDLEKKESKKEESASKFTSSLASGMQKVDDSNVQNSNFKRDDKIPFDPLSTSSPKEVELLMKLAARRKDLEKREATMKERELALKVIEKQQSDKMVALTHLKVTIENLLKKTDKTAQEKIIKLIKVYEGMKPKNVAHMFDRMDISVLKDFIPLMGERKVANILDQMNVIKAKELSMVLINDKSPFAAQPTPPTVKK